MVDGSYSYYLSADLARYTGQWVGIVGNKVVSNGNSARQVYEEAKSKFPDKTPFLACVPKRVAMIL